LKRFCSGQGSKAKEYVDISRLADAAMGKIGQIPKGRRNGFDLAFARLAARTTSRDGRAKAISSPFRRLERVKGGP
jgi:hypothetical protein